MNYFISKTLGIEDPNVIFDNKFVIVRKLNKVCFFIYTLYCFIN
jgi:hypothetical protein